MVDIFFLSQWVCVCVCIWVFVSSTLLNFNFNFSISCITYANAVYRMIIDQQILLHVDVDDDVCICMLMMMVYREMMSWLNVRVRKNTQIYHFKHLRTIIGNIVWLHCTQIPRVSERERERSYRISEEEKETISIFIVCHEIFWDASTFDFVLLL